MRLLSIPFLCVASSLLVQPGRAQWSAPVNVRNLNSAMEDAGVAFSFDGLKLYFTSQASANREIYSTTRPTRYAAFGAPILITELADPGDDISLTVRIDDLEMFFGSIRAGGAGGYDIWRTTRTSPTAPWGTPTNVTELNTSSSDWWPSLSLDGLRLYFDSGRPGGAGGRDIWVATRPAWGQPFGTPTPVTELNSSTSDSEPCISPDGLTMFLTSSRPGTLGGFDIYMATRLTPTAPFGTPVNLTPLNSSVGEEGPGFAQFHDEVYFCSSRAGGLGSFDFYSARFTGLAGSGIAGLASARSLRFSDPSSSGSVFLAAAALGSTPGIQLGARNIPLNPDLLLQLSIGGLPPIMTGFVGILNNDGIATGSVTFQGFPQVLNLRFFTAFLVLDPASPFGIKTISNAHEIQAQ
jgi:hypothetical protein